MSPSNAPLERFELPTLCSEDRCSNPLSYKGSGIFYQFRERTSPFLKLNSLIVPTGSSKTRKYFGFQRKIWLGLTVLNFWILRFESKIRTSIGLFIPKVWIPNLVLKITVWSFLLINSPGIFLNRFRYFAFPAIIFRFDLSLITMP